MPSEELQTFIRANLRSVWELEVLLLISRERGRSWSAEQLNREIRASMGLVSRILGKLEQLGLVASASDGSYRYEPRTPELERMVHDLHEDYAAHPFAVMKAILAAPNEKIQSLADAFKVKKD